MRITAIHTRLMRIPFTELLRAAYGARTHGPLSDRWRFLTPVLKPPCQGRLSGLNSDLPGSAKRPFTARFHHLPSLVWVVLNNKCGHRFAFCQGSHLAQSDHKISKYLVGNNFQARRRAFVLRWQV